ncbi:hypothetical protein TPA0910_71130 [Streptomyces hygroscopicus subsp. sporocinereus]|uniref:Uncharacterized protein n=1 Tax=Streptomyces hygroscopicus TaxID=1912 RepID=A0ABQ3UAQ5_STRHY|nr:hypothetical protein TPA0910_71130 [Streptomyces hygroscopicus]
MAVIRWVRPGAHAPEPGGGLPHRPALAVAPAGEPWPGSRGREPAAGSGGGDQGGDRQRAVAVEPTPMIKEPSSLVAAAKEAGPERGGARPAGTPPAARRPGSSRTTGPWLTGPRIRPLPPPRFSD